MPPGAPVRPLEAPKQWKTPSFPHQTVLASVSRVDPACRPQPQNAIDRELLAKLRACHADGSLHHLLHSWKLESPAVVQELLSLACTTSIATDAAAKRKT